METISNFTFDELEIGQMAYYKKSVSEQDILLFAALSGDTNPVHLDAEYAAGTQFGERIAHGMLTGALVSAAIALELPGPGTVYLGQDIKFRLPVKIGDQLTVKLEILEKKATRKQVSIGCTVVNQNDKRVATGTATALAPTQKLIIEKPAIPSVSINK